MNKKTAIKLAMATAIAASAFTAVAPAQSEAAVNLNIQIKAAKAKMITPYHNYTKSIKLASVDTITVYIKEAKKAQKDINEKIKKAKLSKSEKNKKWAEIKAYNKYITRAEGYVKECQKAQAAKVNAYVKLANGDLSTQDLVDAAKKAKSAIDLSKLKVADQSNLHKKLKDADEKVAAAEKALQGPVVVGVKAVNAKELVVTFNVAVDAMDAADQAKYAVEGETITNAAVSEDGKTVILTTENELKVTNAKVTVSAIKTKEATPATPVLTAEYTDSLTFADTTPVSVQDVEVTGPTAVITFTEPVQNVGTVGINGVALTSGYSLSGNKLTITSLPAEKTYKLNIVGTTDFANNIAKPIVVKIK